MLVATLHYGIDKGLPFAYGQPRAAAAGGCGDSEPPRLMRRQLERWQSSYTMKTCPFCKEQINDEAIKCRFCHSMLLPVQVSEQKPLDDGRVTYVLDRDLIRFGKFSGAVLALFLVVGAYLFGFKLESALEKVRDTQEQLKTTQEKLSAAQRDLEAAQATVKVLKRDVEAVLAEAKSSLGEISEQKAAAIAMVVSIRELTPRETAALQKARAEQPDKIRRGAWSKFWANGTIIRILFLDGDAKSHEAVKQVAQEWAKYANLRFQFVTSGDSEIRVSFKQEGSWSFLGTDALAVAKDQATMNFQWIDRRTLLHEFGHAIGLIEEHLNPKARIHWNRDLVYRELSGPPNFWSKEQIERQVFQRVSEAQLGEYRDFDPGSVMTMTFSPTWTGGTILGKRQDLSESDKALVARIYPRGN